MGQIVNKEDIFKYLDDMRNTGTSNMFGTGDYLQTHFGLDRNTAIDLLLEWMEQAQ